MAKPLDDKAAAAMDKIFNAWLAQNNMISKGGIIYEAGNDGQIKKDAQGNLVNMDPEIIKKKIMSPENGFESFVRKYNKSLEITMRLHPFPEDV